MFGLGGPEVVVIVIAALVLLGPERIPPFARAIGRGYREFIRVRRRVDASLDELKRDLDIDTDEPAPRVSPAGNTQHVPLDQRHALDRQQAGLLNVRAEDDYLSPPGADPSEGARGE